MMGAIGFLMRKTEAWHEKKTKYRELVRNQLQKISKRRGIISCFINPSYKPAKIYPISTDILAEIQAPTKNHSNYLLNINSLNNLDPYDDDSVLSILDQQPVLPTPDLSLSPEEILPEMIYIT